MTETNLLPLGERALSDGQVACFACGTPTPPDETIQSDIYATVVDFGDGRSRVDSSSGSVTFGLCATCRDTRDLATRLLTEHPNVVRSIGAFSVAEHRLTGALDALAIIDMSPPRTVTDSALLDLLNLASLGVGARWSGRFSPVRQPGTSTAHAASEPWLFVPIETRQSIKAEYVRYRAHQMPPRLVPSPSGGCLLCGVRSVLARRGDTPWRPVTADGSTLGARRGGSVSGHLCPDCQAAQDDAGADMLTAALLAVVDSDGALRARRPYPPSIDGLTAWAVSGAEPSRSRFAHVDLHALHALLSTAAW